MNLATPEEGSTDHSSVHEDIVQVSEKTTKVAGEFTYVNEGLEPGSTYVFQLQACNCVGQSGWSDESDEVTLDDELPPPDVPSIVQILPTSVTLRFDDLPTYFTLQPRVVGVKLVSSHDPELHNDVVVEASCIPLQQAGEVTIEHLEPGMRYFFAAALVGEKENGPMSAATEVVLPPFPLEPSPVATPQPATPTPRPPSRPASTKPPSPLPAPSAPISRSPTRSNQDLSKGSRHSHQDCQKAENSKISETRRSNASLSKKSLNDVRKSNADMSRTQAR
ncbi:hypothetical protein M427DRAFT_253340 [Gonapodya prolifera JEL478]|uniref:Fibronectin type-III domain-containing protein n=1 Tax=Gonapodya prolifera (strain JEL478) TaxID=1344416 RepID=A0A139AM48_GONPJ|nr:hypothetical protein M427DRAFT_253340 [Gonapodya prolifera JEL478]|eukprot:KXS17535.1 hypothetical protein M427DRAFT_253340 [Gonapodya prolifera JEL478]